MIVRTRVLIPQLVGGKILACPGVLPGRRVSASSNRAHVTPVRLAFVRAPKAGHREDLSLPKGCKKLNDRHVAWLLRNLPRIPRRVRASGGKIHFFGTGYGITGPDISSFHTLCLKRTTPGDGGFYLSEVCSSYGYPVEKNDWVAIGLPS